MFDRWFTARFRRIFSALILGFTIASMGATASATVVLQPGAPEVSSKGAAAKSMRLAGAIAAVQRTDYDVVLMDIQMPGMDGVELLTRLKSEVPKYKSTPKFVLTTESDPATVARAKEAGATVWMVKPYKEKIMRAGLRKLFGE